jgi:hypothetical protein
MKIKKMKIGDINVAEYNPRKISSESYRGLKKCVETHGLVQPLVWNKRTNRLISGHQRLKVLLDLGWTEVDVVEVDVDQKQEKQMNVALNSTAIHGEWDWDKMADVFDDLTFDEALLTMLDVGDFKSFYDQDEWVVDNESNESNESNIRSDVIYKVIVDCESEKDQTDLLNELLNRNFKVKAMIV